MTFGSGIKTKNLEAMSLGLPVVTTLIGAENINAVNEKDWIVRDREKEFADSIIYLLNNDNYRLSIGKRDSDYVQREWRWDLVKDAFSSLLKCNQEYFMNVLFLAEELRVGGAETYFYSLENNINRNDF